MKYVSHNDLVNEENLIIDENIAKICPFINARDGVKVDEAAINLKKISYQIIMLGMIKATVSLRFDRN